MAETFASWLRSVRTARGLTQTRLAELSGIERTRLNRLERGLLQPTARDCVRLANALGEAYATIAEVAGISTTPERTPHDALRALTDVLQYWPPRSAALIRQLAALLFDPPPTPHRVERVLDVIRSASFTAFHDGRTPDPTTFTELLVQRVRAALME